jgi:hypothetical protein
VKELKTSDKKAKVKHYTITLLTLRILKSTKTIILQKSIPEQLEIAEEIDSDDSQDSSYASGEDQDSDDDDDADDSGEEILDDTEASDLQLDAQKDGKVQHKKRKASSQDNASRRKKASKKRKTGKPVIIAAMPTHNIFTNK